MEMDRKALKLIEEQKLHLSNLNSFNQFDKSLNTMLETSNVEAIVKNGEILYRARIYNEPDVYDKYRNPPKEVFQGYNAESSLAPPADMAKAGRCNQDKISFLYTATERLGAIVEVRPYANTIISLAEIRVTKELRIVDLSQWIVISDDSFTTSFTLRLNNEVSAPINHVDDYLLSQYVTDYIRKNGFDGVKYRSAFSVSDVEDTYYKNVVIFDGNHYEAVNSKLYKVNRINVESSSFDAVY